MQHQEPPGSLFTFQTTAVQAQQVTPPFITGSLVVFLRCLWGQLCPQLHSPFLARVPCICVQLHWKERICIVLGPGGWGEQVKESYRNAS